MSNPAPGWYDDPAQQPGMYRWWDGHAWTSGLTDDPSIPPQGDPALVHAASMPPSRDGEGVPVPPPPGAPGPSYEPPSGPGLPEPGAGPAASEAPPANHRRDPTPYVILCAILAVLLGGGLWLLFTGGDDPEEPLAGAEPTTPAPNTPSPTDPPSPEPDQPGPEPLPETPPPPQQIPRLEFDPLGGDWVEDPSVTALIPRGEGQMQLTEPEWDGGSWRAVVVAGYAPGEVLTDPEALDPAGQAEAVSAWFETRGFSGAEVETETLEAEPIEVDGHSGFLLHQRFTFEVDGLQATSEDVTIVVVDLGPQYPTGLFIGSVPDTHVGLEADVETARDSLRVVE